MSYNITGTTITLTRGDTFEALVSATKRDGTQYIPVEGDSIRFAMKENYDDPRPPSRQRHPDRHDDADT